MNELRMTTHRIHDACVTDEPHMNVHMPTWWYTCGVWGERGLAWWRRRRKRDSDDTDLQEGRLLALEDENARVEELPVLGQVEVGGPEPEPAGPQGPVRVAVRVPRPVLGVVRQHVAGGEVAGGARVPRGYVG